MTSNRNRIAEGDWVITVVVWLMRIVVGGVFVFSGFAKAVDPWGSLYKFNEYLLTLGLDGLQGLSLFGAFAVPVVETVLGLMLLLGAYRRSVPWLLLLMMLIMLPLTMWLALTNAVPDCGCFGDALVLSNWGTFWKNLALTMGIVFLLIFNKSVKGLYGPAVQWIAAALTFAATLVIAFYGYFTQPLVDFRPYKVGVSLSATQPNVMSEDDYVFIYSKDGKEHEFTINNLPNEDDGWVYVDRRPVPRASHVPATTAQHSLAVFDGGTDVSGDVMESSRMLLLFLFPDLQDVNISHTFMINELADYARDHGAAVYGICSASEGQIARWNDISMADYPMLTADDSDLKMIARGNPAVVYVEDGKLTWKRTLGSIDKESLQNSQLALATLSDDFQPSAILQSILSAFGLLMIALLIVNRSHVVIGKLFFRRRTDSSHAQADEPDSGGEIKGE